MSAWKLPLHEYDDVLDSGANKSIWKSTDVRKGNAIFTQVVNGVFTTDTVGWYITRFLQSPWTR